MDDELTKLVKLTQASIVESAESRFDESDIPHLRSLTRLTVEFHHYLNHGSTQLAKTIRDGPFAKYVPDAHVSSEDRFNRHDLRFVCESVRSGVDSFCILNQSYAILENAVDSRVEWNMISSRESFKRTFNSMFEAFMVEMDFEPKCRFLLDLFKLQIVFAGISYND